jgi:Mrp family chromosome partitioning ATPase
MGPTDYVSLFRSRWWIVASLVLVGGALAWVATPAESNDSQQTLTYRAETVLVQGPTSDETGRTNLLLASSLVSSNVVLERSATQLGRPVAELSTGLTSIVNADTRTLMIASEGSDAESAESEADAIAAQLQTYLVERRQDQLEPLIAATTQRISDLETRLRTFDTQPPAPLGSSQADLQRAERDSVVRQLSTNYDRLQQLNVQANGSVLDLVVLNPAVASLVEPSTGFAVPESRPARASIGALIGLIVGAALVIVFERINPRIRTVVQAEAAFGLPVVSEIPRQSRRLRLRRSVATFSDPFSAIAESYRSLRTALWYIPRTEGPHPETNDRLTNGHVVLVTSAGPGDGKTTVAANLAAALAEKDGDVVVVSGDARQPEIEALLLGRRAAGARLAITEQSDSVLTMIPGVKLVLSCDPDSNPADIVGHEAKIARRERTRSQIVLIDTPPALVANDASELMHTADSIVLVARCGSTSVASARRLGELIARMRAPVVGVVLIGSDEGVGSESRYYRKRPSRRRARSAPRQLAPPIARPETPSHFEPEVAAEPLAVASPDHATTPVPATNATDDGGIWRRPNTLIDLANGDRLPARPSITPSTLPPRSTRSTVGDGYPSRDALDSNAPIPRPSDYDHATAARPAPRLPLFRAGGGNGHNHERER